MRGASTGVMGSGNYKCSEGVFTHAVEGGSGLIRYGLVVHGGAGVWDADVREAVRGVRAAATLARRILAVGGAAIDAVMAAVVALEDDPLFNAGIGACLNRDGEAEMDAQVMVGEGLRVGAVAALTQVRNPVLVARRVMEQTEHVLLAGAGALRFAREMGFAVDRVLAEMSDTVGTPVGLIAVDGDGCPGLAFGTPHMPFAYLREGDSDLTSGLVR